jgi:myo-inositol-1(or 4)-monophosphatase
MKQTEKIIEHLHNLFENVAKAIKIGVPEGWSSNQRNAKGDQVKWFDLVADETVSVYLEKEFPYSVNLLSEEGEPRQFGKGSPEYTIVLDPVDGSENFLRGLPPAGMAIALIPADTCISVDTIRFAFVGNLFTEDIFWAAKGEGTFLNNKLVHPRLPEQFTEMLISCDLNHYLIPAHINRFLAQFRGVRSLGAATLALATVATGSCGIHLDSRGRLTPENFLAPALLITEAGGVISDLTGATLPEINTLTDRFSIVAATTPALHEAAIQQLEGM